MAHLDDRIGIPHSALTAVPLLLLPMVIGAAGLLIWPHMATGTAAIVLSSVAVGWYLLGGAISVAHARRRVASRRALAMVRAEATAAPEPIWICDGEGQVIFQNQAARDEFGDITGRGILSLLIRLRADAESELTQLTRRALYSKYVEMPLASGDVLALSSSPDGLLQIWSYHDNGHGLRALYLDDGDDVDDFEAMPVALLKIAPDGTIRRANAAARRLLDGAIPGDDDRTVHIGALLEGPGRPVGQWIADVLANEMDMRSEILRLRMGEGRDSVERYFQVSLAPDPTDRPGVIAVLSDASALKTLEAQFVQSQKMQAIGQLAGGVAHDFNNLLTAIRGHCDLLMLRHDKRDPDYADLDQISQNTNRAAALVGQLLAFSRKQNLKLELLDPRDTLADLTHLLNRLVGERITLDISHDRKLRPIRADKRQLEQVIMNLVVNARDAMPDGGEITVRSDNIHLEEPLLRDRVSLPQGDYVRIEVRDQGGGIAPDMLDKIFEPFFTTKRTGEGTGLGLSTAYGIVKQTGGYIFCDSEPGKGSNFSLYFPAHAYADLAPQPVSAPEVASDMRNEQRATVLLVEDEAPVRAFASRALQLKGYEVHEADSAETALELLADNRLHVDVFVTDVVMPGMDGPTWVRSALKDRPDTRVVFMSGYTDDIFGEGHSPVPNSAFLAKPFTLAELTQIVSQQLEAPEKPPLH
ncbi:ATP-binding protein [Paracoccus fistulariae]|nr:ATP-binding protein [Paracoccus fistulariae]MDB6180220.1 ATP-binding protein [Paracoccus fistulariae]